MGRSVEDVSRCRGCIEPCVEAASRLRRAIRRGASRPGLRAKTPRGETSHACDRTHADAHNSNDSLTADTAPIGLIKPVASDASGPTTHQALPTKPFAAQKGPSRENAAKPMRHRTPTRWAPGPSLCSLTVTSSDPGSESVRSSTCHKSVAPSRLAAVKRVSWDCSQTCTTSEHERRNMHGGPGSPCIFQRV